MSLGLTYFYDRALGESPMLDNLDQVDWGSLSHAYGEAGAVPGLLRELASSDPKQREEALIELFGTIWHQGTVYSATAAAVPFLYEFLTTPEVQDKSGIACLLACIADGKGSLEVHARSESDQASWRRIFAKQGKTFEEELQREKTEMKAVRSVISAGLRHLIPYLKDPAPDIRPAIAVALGNYPEHAEWTIPALESAAATESDEYVRQMLMESKARLSKVSN